VVLESIVRLREKGLSTFDASLQGAQQVWGALLASTAITVAIFLPVIFMREVEGQLFSDLSITITIAVVVSLGNFALALVVLFLLLAVLFRSLKDSFLVVLAMPLAMVGGVVAIRLLNLVTFQPVDLLAMISFVILLSLVVNNAIFLVHQTRSAEREGVSRHHAVEQAHYNVVEYNIYALNTKQYGAIRAGPS
jgi:multidrug efflux pump subunit AcrB